MNLENLKSEWSAMNARMEKQEIFKEKIFCQILNTKSDKSLSRLVAYEVIGLIVCILFIPVFLYISNNIEMGLVRPIVVSAIIIFVICVVWQGIKIWGLFKIDFTKTLKNKLLYINKLIFTIFGCVIEPGSGFWLFLPQALINIVASKKI